MEMPGEASPGDPAEAGALTAGQETSPGRPTSVRAAGRGERPWAVADIAALAAGSPARCGNVKLICIDGPAGAGKTTLAAQLQEVLGAPVVHMDDLYQGWSQDIGSPLAARLAAWLLDPWEAGLSGQYLHYDWVGRRYEKWVAVPPAPVIILEGCGCASAAVRTRASLVVWVQAQPDLRLTRGLARDGAQMAGHWRDWQDREDRHFAADATALAADLEWLGA